MTNAMTNRSERHRSRRAARRLLASSGLWEAVYGIKTPERAKMQAECPRHYFRGTGDCLYCGAKDPNHTAKTPSADTAQPQVPGTSIVEIIVSLGLLDSKSGARRMIKQGGVYIDDARVMDGEYTPTTGDHTIRIGKKRHCRIMITSGGNREAVRVYQDWATEALEVK